MNSRCRRFLWGIWGGALLTGALCFFSVGSGLGNSPPGKQGAQDHRSQFSPWPEVRLEGTVSRAPLLVIENRGQVDRLVRYYHYSRELAVWYTREGVTLSLRRGTSGERRRAGGLQRTGKEPADQVVTLIPLGMRPECTPEAVEPQTAKVHYYLGNDPARWQSDVPTYRAVLYREAYPGIDLKFYGAGGQLEYDVIVRPDADPSQVRFKVAGAKDLKVTPAGDLALMLPGGGQMVQKKPLVYQEAGGQRLLRDGRFTVHRHTAGLTWGFTVAGYDRSRPLVIDPVLEYATYLGGVLEEYGSAIAVDADGNAVIAGWTRSLNFPARNAFQPTIAGGKDAFIAKFDPQGQLLFSTFMGGAQDDICRSVALDRFGQIFITGSTASATTFPLDDPFQSAYGGGEWDAFVAMLGRDGRLATSSYLGGRGADHGLGITVNFFQKIFVTGTTDSANFPTTEGAYQRTCGGSYDAFVSKLEWTGSGFIVVYSSFLGGDARDEGLAICSTDSGRIYVTGRTGGHFPTKNPLQSLPGGLFDAFVAGIYSDGTDLIFSTYLGGGGDDEGWGITVDAFGGVYVTGSTYSVNFPLVNPLYSNRGGADAFVAKLTRNGTVLAFSTCLGGSSEDKGRAIQVDPKGDIYITGYTRSTDFPTALSMFPFTDGSAGFVTRIAKDGRALVYSTLISCDYLTSCTDLGLDRKGNVYVTGNTQSSHFPVYKAWQPVKGGLQDAFVCKIRQSVYVPYLLLLLGE